MKTKYITLLLFLLFFSSTYSQSDEFTFIGSTNDGDEYYVLIQKTNSYSTELWLKKSIPIKTIKNKSGKLIKIGGGYELTYITIKCDDITYNIGEYINYYKNGNIKSSGNIDSYDNKVVPGTIISSVFKYVCSE